MINNRNLIRKPVAALLITIGVAAMASAWFILLSTATHNVNVVGLEIGGVAVTLAGYFLWKRSKLAGKELEPYLKKI